jgi:hypothetical protein
LRLVFELRLALCELILAIFMLRLVIGLRIGFGLRCGSFMTGTYKRCKFAKKANKGNRPVYLPHSK